MTNLTAWITRNAEEASPYIIEAGKQGVLIRSLPVFERRVLGFSETTRKVLKQCCESKVRGLLTFSSPSCVDFFVAICTQSDVLGTSQILFEKISEKKILLAAVGGATRKRLADYFSVEVLMSTDSAGGEALLRELRRHFSRPLDWAVVFGARNGRSELEAGLRRLGWRVEPSRIYEATPIKLQHIDIKGLLSEMPTALIFTSPSAVKALVAGVKKFGFLASFSQCAAIAFGTSTDKALRLNGFMRREILNFPNPKTVVEAIKKIC